MSDLELARLDANLLITLDVLLEERSVTAAAKRQGVTQSAMSQALARLRGVFGDRLLVRSGAAMVPTPRAMQLATPLRHALDSLQAAISRAPTFEPAESTRSFAVAATDYLTQVLVPPLVSELRARAPHVSLDVRSVHRDDIPDALERGHIDVGTAVSPSRRSEALRSQKLFDESFLGLAREGHPLLEDPDTAAFAAVPQVLVAPRGKPGGLVDRILEAQGLAREVAVRVPFFLSAPAIIAATDMVMVLPARLAREAARAHPVALFEPPVRVGGFTIEQIWHLRYDDEPGSIWLRELIVEVAGDL
jgi:DNA-binding transcriptional LysR family regulator